MGYISCIPIMIYCTSRILVFVKLIPSRPFYPSSHLPIHQSIILLFMLLFHLFFVECLFCCAAYRRQECTEQDTIHKYAYNVLWFAISYAIKECYCKRPAAALSMYKLNCNWRGELGLRTRNYCNCSSISVRSAISFNYPTIYLRKFMLYRMLYIVIYK